jgi:hypothetical protein
MTITRTNSIRPSDCTRTEPEPPELVSWGVDFETGALVMGPPTWIHVRGLAVREHRDDYEDITGERTHARAIWSEDARDIQTHHPLDFVPDRDKARWFKPIATVERTGRHWSVVLYTAPWTPLDGSFDDFKPSTPPNVYTQFKPSPDGWGWVVDTKSTYGPRQERDLGTTAIGPEDLYAISPGGYDQHAATHAHKD